MRKKYFKSLAAARKACAEYSKIDRYQYGVYKMPRGSRHPGMYAVCSYLEWINTY